MHIKDFIPYGELNLIRRPFLGRGVRALPPEIWIIILDMVIEDSILPSLGCSVFDFPKFVRDCQIDQSRPNEEWERLRLVCRLWSVLLNPHGASDLPDLLHKPHLRLDSPSRLLSAIGVRSFSLADTSEWPIAEFKPYPLNIDILSITRNVVSISIGSSGSFEAKTAFLDFIFSYSVYFPNIRALAIRAWESLVPEFWKRLQEAFPRLTALQIQGPYYAHGEITLPNLEVLILDLVIAPEFNFPSLKHLWIHNSSAEFPLLFNHGRTLESLVTGSNISQVSLDESFWTSFPKLQILGGPVSLFQNLCLPPPDHPFDHAWTLWWWTRNSTIVDDIASRFHSLRYWTVQPSGGRPLWTLPVRTSRWNNRVRYVDGALEYMEGSFKYPKLIMLFYVVSFLLTVIYSL